VTEAEWHSSDDPAAMLEFLRHRVPRRKVLLFAAACLERLGTTRTRARCAALADTVRRYADGQETFEALETGQKSFRARKGPAYRDSPLAYLDWALLFPELRTNPGEVWSKNGESSALLRCLAGDPFRPVKFNETWLTANGGAVSRLARAIQGERSFDGLPVLADALEDAGCGTKPLLEHCRAGGPHVPGCWALDLILNWPQPRRPLVESWDELDRRNYEVTWTKKHEPFVPAKRPHPFDDKPLGFSFFRSFLEDDDLSNMTMPRTFFCRSGIERMRFVNTDLSESWMCWDDFTDCDFSGADLRRSDMRASVFRRCTFNGADLRRADIRHSSFEGCEFTGARLKGTHGETCFSDEHDLEAELSPEQHAAMRWSRLPGPEPEGG
jgi:hypothetical protein